jgi:hypothetical protein
MIASACIASQLPPEAFGIDAEDVPLIAEEMLELLHEQSRRAEMERAQQKLSGHGY